ncbi:type 12 methyltransferase [Ferriphaselus amnicola]|uniref:Type 12 methyltransferase n=1 Tax=Ferriphaselus amnicola TaxID=1188319 RepID=A0A2Z6GCK2_9PROT|nr:class I SAM-dependent methyltransferase [Ferriphaselus amnicola]BBE51112.1 type 12 methyltransferase [Ferriphaselus amnicola]
MKSRLACSDNVSLPRRLPPAVIALLLQGLAFFLAILLARFTTIPFTPLSLALVVGALAATLSHLAGQARWWVPIQFIFAPAQVAMLAVDVAPTLYLVIFLILLAVYWSTFRTQVPLYLSSHKVWRALEDLLPPMEGRDKSFSLMDIGSGLGGVLAHLSAVRPDGHYLGVEIAPLPFVWSWLRLRLKPNCHVRWGSLWDCDLSQYDVVFAYLSPVPMAELWEKARREMKSGSLFISNTFAVPEFPPQQTVQVDDLHHSSLYIWRM